jgi:hypothetical protein
MKGADFEPRLAPTIAIARDGSLCFRHLSPAIRGTVSSNPACSRDESGANFLEPESDLQFVMAQLARLPTRKEMALRPLYIIAGSAGLVILCIELFRRACL